MSKNSNSLLKTILRMSLVVDYKNRASAKNLLETIEQYTDSSYSFNDLINRKLLFYTTLTQKDSTTILNEIQTKMPKLHNI